jgi:hypothetical protein
MYLLKKQTFATVTHLVEGLSLESITDVKGGKVFNLLSGYTEANSIHNIIIIIIIIIYLYTQVTV